MDEFPAPVPLERLLDHRAWVRRLAFAVAGGRGDAEDLEQEAWRAALESDPRTDGSVRGWFRIVLRNASMNRARGDERRRAREEAAARPEAGRSAADLVVEAEAHKRVVVAVMDLEEPFRTTVLMRFFEDLPLATIAARQAVPLETARTRLRRAVARLRDALRDRRDRGRGAGFVVLLPLVRPRAGHASAWTGGAALSSGAGVLLMGAKTKTAVAAAMLLLLAGGGTWFAIPALLPAGSGDTVRGGRGGSLPVAGAQAPAPAADAAGAPPPPPEDMGPRFAGFVVTRDGAPVAGALVVAAPDTASEAIDPAAAADGRGAGRAARTDAAGSFSVPAPAGGPFYDLAAGAEGYSPAILRGVRPVGGLRIVLSPEAALLGRVMDLEGAPVAGARVRWLGTMGSIRIEREGVSRADGAYRVAGIPFAPAPDPAESGRHWIEAGAAGFAPQIVDAAQAALDGSGERRLDLWLLRGAVLRGRVVDAEDGRPLPGARLVLWSNEASTSYSLPDGGYAGCPWSTRRLGETVADPGGEFRFENVPAWGVRPAGIHTASPWERWLGFVGAAPAGYAPMGIRVNVPREGETVDLDVRCWPEAFVEGRVVTSAGAAVPNALIFLRNEERPSWWLPEWFPAPGRPTYQTDADGRYRIGWVSAPRRQPGTLEVMARGPGSNLGDPGPAVTVSVAAGMSTRVPDLVLEEGLASPVVDLLAADEAGGPVAGASVLREGWVDPSVAARTDEAGKARVLFRGQEPSALRFRVRHPAYADAVTEEVTPSKEDPPQVRVVLRPVAEPSAPVLAPDAAPVEPEGPSVPVEGTVRDAGTGKPILKFHASISDGKRGVRSRSVAPGRFRFDSVAPGTWTLHLDAEGYDSLRREGIVVGAEGPAEPLDCALDAGGTLRGVLRFPEGEGTPAVRLLLRSQSAGAGYATATVGSSGRFEVIGLRRGARYRPLVSESDSRGTPRMWVPANALEVVAPGERDPDHVEWDLARAGCLGVKVSSPRLLPGGSIESATEEQMRSARESEVVVVDAAGGVVARGNLVGNNVFATYLPLGAYIVRVTLPGGATQEKSAALYAVLLRLEFDFP